MTNAQGDVQHFAYWSNKYSLEGAYECGFAQGLRLASWTFPQGVEVDLNYGNRIDYQKGGAVGSDGFEQLVSVTNTSGREDDPDLPSGRGPLRRTQCGNKGCFWPTSSVPRPVVKS